MFKVVAEGGNQPIEWFAEKKPVATLTALCMSEQYPQLRISVYEPGSDDLLYQFGPEGRVLNLDVEDKLERGL